MTIHQNTRWRRLWLLPGILLLAFCTLPEPLHAVSERFTETVRSELVANDARLRDGKWKQAKSDATSLMLKIGKHMPCEGADMLGTAIFQYALALSGRGNEDQARWYAGLAHSINPSITPDDANSYGPAGEAIAYLLADPRAAEVGGAKIYSVPRGEIYPEGLKAPIKVAGKLPRYSEDARQRQIEGTVYVSLLIDTSGNTTRPHIVDCSKGINELTWLTLDALRHWRFKPATMNGKPVPMRYLLWTNFDLN